MTEQFRNDQEKPLRCSFTDSLEPERLSPEIDENEDFRPFKTIWTQPRRTVRQILSRDPTLHVIPLAALAGIGGTLDRASNSSTGDEIPMLAIIGIACVLGPLGALSACGLGPGCFEFPAGGLEEKPRRNICEPRWRGLMYQP